MNSSSSHGRSELWRTVRFLIGAFTLLLLLAIPAYIFFILPMQKTATLAKTSLDKVLQTITSQSTHVVEGRAEISESKEISELALLEMKMSATRTIEKSEQLSILPLGTKKLIVRGHYRVKGGYRLQRGISLRMENGNPVAHFPKAEILSVELIDYEVLSEDSGWLNYVQPADRSQILRELRDQMKEEAEQSGMLGIVENTLLTRLRDLLGVDHVTLEQPLP